MNNRIVGPDGRIPMGDGPSREPTLAERLQLAVNLWNQGKKGEAFATSLNSIAYLSQAFAAFPKLTGEMQKALDCDKDEIAQLRENNQLLSSALAHAVQRIEALEKAKGP